MTIKPPVIVLIDDDEDDRDMFAIALKTAEPEAKLITASNGPEALKILEAAGVLPAFIFVDLNMPFMNGIECLAAIKKLPLIKEVPVVIYTTTSSKEYAEETKNGGAAYFLVKPNSLYALSDMLEQILMGVKLDYFLQVKS